MIRSVFFLFLAATVINIDCTTLIGNIYNATYVSSDNTNVIEYKSTCLECICYAFFSSVPPPYVGLNCYQNNKTCVLFANYSSLSMVQTNFDSTFSFIQQPPSQTMTAVPTITSTVPATTETSSVTTSFLCVSLHWNSTGTTLAASGSASNQVSLAYAVFIAAGSDVLYIVDTNNNRIQKWLPGASSATTVAGGQGQGKNATQLNNPRALWVDENANLFVADRNNYRVQVFANGSSFGRTIISNGTTGTPNNLIGNLFGIGVDLASNVYISEYNYNRILKLPPNATNATLAAGNGTAGNSPNQLNVPTGFYVDPTTGTLYIASQNAHCIVKWLPDAPNGTTIAGKCGTSGSNETLLNTPKWVTFDKYSNMYVIDGTGNSSRITMFCPNSLVGIPIVTSGLNSPQSIAVDTSLSLYVADFNNNRIVKYKLL